MIEMGFVSNMLTKPISILVCEPPDLFVGSGILWVR